jgi:hypothetical protein
LQRVSQSFPICLSEIFSSSYRSQWRKHQPQGRPLTPVAPPLVDANTRLARSFRDQVRSRAGLGSLALLRADRAILGWLEVHGFPHRPAHDRRSPPLLKHDRKARPRQQGEIPPADGVLNKIATSPVTLGDKIWRAKQPAALLAGTGRVAEGIYGGCHLLVRRFVLNERACAHSSLPVLRLKPLLILSISCIIKVLYVHILSNCYQHISIFQTIIR